MNIVTCTLIVVSISVLVFAMVRSQNKRRRLTGDLEVQALTPVLIAFATSAALCAVITICTTDFSFFADQPTVPDIDISLAHAPLASRVYDMAEMMTHIDRGEAPF